MKNLFVSYLEPIINESLDRVNLSLDNPITKEEKSSFLGLMKQLQSDISDYSDMFSPDTHGKIIEINDKLHKVDVVGGYEKTI
jgi:hypothetical protein